MSCSSMLNFISVRATAKMVWDHSVFDALHCVKASPSARRVMAANVVCGLIEIFSDNGIFLKYTIKSNAI